MSEIALSYSRYSVYDKCARKFDLQYNRKAFPDDSNNPAFLNGNMRHEEMEDYVNWRNRAIVADPGPKPFMAPVCENVKPIIDKLYDSGFKVFPEQKMAIDKDHRPVSWFDRSTYYRCIVDVLAIKNTIAVAGDYKTGKVYDYEEWGGQLHLNAMFIFFAHPQVNTVKCAYWYMEHSQSITITIYRDELDKLKAHFRAKYDKINSETEWAPTKNKFCYFCPATKAQCEIK